MPTGSRSRSTPCVACPGRDICGTPTDGFFRVPGELPAGCCDVPHTIRSHERVKYPGLQPVGLVVAGPGNCESDEPYSGHRPHPGQGLCRLSNHRRVLDIQQQPHQHSRSLRNISEGGKVTPGPSTLLPRRRQRLSQGRLQPTHHLRHDPTVSCPTNKIQPRTEAAHTLDEEHRGTPWGQGDVRCVTAEQVELRDDVKIYIVKVWTILSLPGAGHRPRSPTAAAEILSRLRDGGGARPGPPGRRDAGKAADEALPPVPASGSSAPSTRRRRRRSGQRVLGGRIPASVPERRRSAEAGVCPAITRCGTRSARSSHGAPSQA
ncbi:hypothetical protein DFJ69_6338 [Thermomonospora umbrina]|uniref:Uncharacterized protein n=1 Tax=Thermomonospora umbrina TaxID=111806 RepID=A0A3D9SYV0_9ACTN|nr:hypothetical protein DFJ69_6338 [Thermomonospora umbrina]